MVLQTKNHTRVSQRGHTKCPLTSNDPNCKTCKVPRPREPDVTTALTCAGAVCNFRRNSEAYSRQITKSDAKKTNQGCNNATQQLCRIFSSCWIPHYLVKHENSSDTMPTSDKPGRSFTDKFLEPTRACEELVWNPNTSALRRSETHGIAVGAFRIVLVQSGLAEGWQTDKQFIKKTIE